ncbi:MAG: sulfotransferase [Xanthomarina gelatinilytica]|uniref:sulfotransferase n=1 Tax=Xanthomarina gelatinilytica TaxID=1137281 RepID=UPI003A86FB29
MLKSLIKRLKNSFKKRFNIFCKQIIYKALILQHNQKKWNKYSYSNKEIIWVLGMFRSGTSLTSQILMELGADFGSNNDLLKPIGKFKNLNPNGFFENFILVEYSRYFLNEINKSGSNPPKTNEEVNVSFNDVKFNKLVYLSLFKINEDRVLLINKYRAFRKLSKSGIYKYAEKYFSDNATIKNPSLSFFYEQIDLSFPNSKYLIVYRNPDSVLKSSRVLTEKNNYELYNTYHEHFIELKDKKNVTYFSYDNLIKNPEASIKKLSKELSLKSDIKSINKAVNLLDDKLLRNKPDKMYLQENSTKIIFNELNSMCCNQNDNIKEI